MEFKQDIFEPNIDFVLEELSESEKAKAGGTAVLAKVKGVFFVPDGISRNKRFYPQSLWEKALSKKDVKEKLSNKRMFGTIGHDQVINDTAILEGKISHIVTGLNIENGQGIGEALILDTPAGRGLNTLLQAGSKLFVSSRALGRFKGEKNGLPVVDENTYQLQTFDFVIDPGFLEANPTLKESLESVFDEKPISNHNEQNTGEGEMDNKELANHIIDQNKTLGTDLETAISENESLKDQLAVSKNEVVSLKEENEELLSVKEELEAFKALGTVESIKESIEAKDSLEAELKEYKEIDTDIEGPKDIIEAIDLAQAKLDEYRKIGTPESITEGLTKLSEFKDKVLEYGNVEEIEKLYSFAESQIEREKVEEEAKKIKALADELGVSEEKIKKVYGKLSEEEIKETFKGLKEDSKKKDLQEQYSADEADLEGTNEGNGDEEDDETFAFETSTPLVERLMAKHRKPGASLAD